MRLQLNSTLSLEDSLAQAGGGGAGGPPLAFIDDEPFLIELQGSLELPGSEKADGVDMGGTIVGKLDTTEPNKPILQIAHHRLEGKLVKLVEPYALLRTTPAATPLPLSSSSESLPPRLSDSIPTPSTTEDAPPLANGDDAAPPEPSLRDVQDGEQGQPRIDILALIRRKIVFSRRPEPIIELSSDAPDIEMMGP
ncbi:hypothetical protein RQP46_002693 [Phenoliferia psychrophenolica]